MRNSSPRGPELIVASIAMGLLVSITACESSTSPQGGSRGTFVLTHIGNNAMPVVETRNGQTTHFLADTVVLREDGTGTRTTHIAFTNAVAVELTPLTAVHNFSYRETWSGFEVIQPNRVGCPEGLACLSVYIRWHYDGLTTSDGFVMRENTIDGLELRQYKRIE